MLLSSESLEDIECCASDLGRRLWMWVIGRVNDELFHVGTRCFYKAKATLIRSREETHILLLHLVYMSFYIMDSPARSSIITISTLLQFTVFLLMSSVPCTKTSERKFPLSWSVLREIY